MKGLKDYKFKLVWASSFMWVKAFEQFFYAIGGNLYIMHFGVWAGFKGGVRARVMFGCWDGRGRGFEPDALKEWKINIFKIMDTRISFYSRNTHLLPPKPKSSFRHLKRGIQDFHMNYVLVPADKAANNVVVV